MPDVIADVRSFMATQLRIVGAESVGPETPLVKRGVLDSIELMQIVEFLEATYSIRIDDIEILPENLGSLALMAALVERKLSR